MPWNVTMRSTTKRVGNHPGPEDWRHFPRGAHHKFEIWTDHKNLEYFMSAKKLNHRQAVGLCTSPGSTLTCTTARTLNGEVRRTVTQSGPWYGGGETMTTLPFSSGFFTAHAVLLSLDYHLKERNRIP